MLFTDYHMLRDSETFAIYRDLLVLCLLICQVVFLNYKDLPIYISFLASLTFFLMYYPCVA